MKTPYFLIHESELKQNVECFQRAIETHWPNAVLSYSVKTNSLPWLLRYLRELGLHAEVVSDDEYDLAKLCGFADDQIVFNGPIKSCSLLKNAIANGAIVNLDSEREIQTVMQLPEEDRKNIGLRINLDPNGFSHGEVDYQTDGFRFGFSDSDGRLGELIQLLDLRAVGLHVHCNSITRSVAVYREIARQTAELIRRYHLNVHYVDIGGGFFGGVPGKPTAMDYISTIREELEDTVDVDQTKLILEPGSAIIGSAADYVTSVTDVKRTQYADVVTTDGSRLHIDPLWKKTRYLFSCREAKDRPSSKNQIVCGFTCMDHDRIMVLKDQPALSVGDRLVYHRVGAYSMTMSGMFIRMLPDVFVEHTNASLELVRKRRGAEAFYELHSADNSGF